MRRKLQRNCQLFSRNYDFSNILEPTTWPLHLCNTAMYIIPLCLLFKWDKLFYFTYFINVLGAFLAIALPNYDVTANVLGTRIVDFYINHYNAFFMPILMVSLKVYARPNLRKFIYSMIGFLIYFVLALVLNAWFSNYGTVDYFFLNSDFIVEKLGRWAEKIKDISATINVGDISMVFYPAYQAIFFGVYVLLGAGMWFLYTWCYDGADLFFDILERRKKIRLDRLALELSMDGRSLSEPMNKENANKLILRNFSKRYGTSTHYAVKNANFTLSADGISITSER